MDPNTGLRFIDPKQFDPAKWKQKVCIIWADNVEEGTSVSLHTVPGS